MSKDEEGLESVRLPASGRVGDTAARPLGSRPYVETPARISLSAPSELSGEGSSGSQSVVVDPDSQIPPPPRDDFNSQRGSLEKTQVLKGRRLDVLRAEVDKRHRAQVRERRERLVLWGAAGACAVLFGGLIAGFVLAPQAEGVAGSHSTIEGSGDSEPKVAQISSSSRPVMESEVASDEVETKPRVVALSLEDLPIDDDYPEREADEEQGFSAPSEVVELDDLPFD